HRTSGARILRRDQSATGNSSGRAAVFVFLFTRASHRSLTARLDALEPRRRGDAKRNVRFRIVRKSTSADLEPSSPRPSHRRASQRNALATSSGARPIPNCSQVGGAPPTFVSTRAITRRKQNQPTE